MRLMFGTIVALPTTVAFVALSVVVVLGRSAAALGIRALTRATSEHGS